MATKIHISFIRYPPPFLKINFQKVDIQTLIAVFSLILGIVSKEMAEKVGRKETNSGLSETNSRPRLYLYGRK